MSAKRFTGKTESDAVMNAAMELGIPSTDLKYTVIDPGSNGFFGLFKKPVIIEIKEEEKKETEQVVPQKPPNKPKKTEYSTDFQRFWGIYPRKDGKGEAYKKYKARLNDGWSPDELCEAAENYKKKLVRDRTESKYIKHAKTFLSENTPFEDFLNKQENNRVEESQEDEGNPFR